MNPNNPHEIKEVASVVDVPTASDQPESSLFYLLIVIVWAVCGIIAARLLGASRPKSIRGPDRILQDESAWWMLMILCGSFLIAGRVALLAKPYLQFGLPPAANTLLSGGITEALIVIFVIIISMIVRKDAIRLTGLRLQQFPMGIVGGIVTMFILFPLIVLTELLVTQCFTWLHRQPPKPHEVLQMIHETSDHRVVVIGIVMATVVAPIFEELFFRGMVQTMLGKLVSFAFRTEPHRVAVPILKPAAFTEASPSTGAESVPLDHVPLPTAGCPSIGCRARWLAVILTSIAFAASHLEPAFLAPIFVLSVGLGYVYERTGNLWMTMAAHSAFNSLQILLFLHG